MQVLQSLPLNKIGISSCLIGNKCRYDGNSSRHMVQFENCVCFCPEILGGLRVPRIPCEIEKGDGRDVWQRNARVIGRDGVDRTDEYKLGAQKALKICLENGLEAVILKEKSPSCGCRLVYNAGHKVAGCGVTAALIEQNGIKIISDTEV